MVAMAAVERPLSREDELLKTFLELDVPPDFKAELIEGEIIMTPPPDGDHEDVVARFARVVARHAAEELYVSGAKGLITPNGRFVPDGAVAAVGTFRSKASWSEPVGVLLVFEVTSSNPVKDRVQKRHGYAAAGIPFYLLVDRSEGRVTLFSRPAKEDYTAENSVKFGDPLDLPAPFSFTLDTEPLG